MRARAQRETPRQRLEQAIERAIALLDAMDGDCDLEPDYEDPEQVPSTVYGFDVRGINAGQLDDDEPSLGWTATYATGSTDDREASDMGAPSW